jgi:hypothetical protein
MQDDASAAMRPGNKDCKTNKGALDNRLKSSKSTCLVEKLMTQMENVSCDC